MALADQIHELMWKTGPRALSTKEIAGGLGEMYAVRPDDGAIRQVVGGDCRFRAEADGFRLDRPDSDWDRFQFSAG